MLITECINLGIIELDFITVNKDPVSILQHEDCEPFKQVAYLQLQKKQTGCTSL
jgi:hypothetical protein